MFFSNEVQGEGHQALGKAGFGASMKHRKILII